jgi:hypothetical protein
MNYLMEPKGAARQIPMGQAPLREPRGQARQIPMGLGQYLSEPRGQARQIPMGADVSIKADLPGGITAEYGTQKAPAEEKILGMSKPVAYGVGAVVLAGVLYFALVR